MVGKIILKFLRSKGWKDPTRPVIVYGRAFAMDPESKNRKVSAQNPEIGDRANRTIESKSPGG